MSCWLSGMGNKYDLIELRSTFALLDPNTGETLHLRSEPSWRRSNNWFVSLCEV